MSEGKKKAKAIISAYGYMTLTDYALATFNVQRSMFNVQRSMFNVQCSTFNVQRSMFNVQCFLNQNTGIIYLLKTTLEEPSDRFSMHSP